MKVNGSAYAAVIIVVLILALGVYFILASPPIVSPTFSSTTTSIPTTTVASAAASTASHPIFVTDPSFVPSGTSALVISYSSIKLHELGSGNNYVTVLGSGSLNLTALSKNGRAIGIAQAASNVTFDYASFVITSANITINGRTYSVFVPNATISARISGNSTANVSGNSGIAISLSPTVMQVYGTGSPQFAMTSYARAVAISSFQINSSGSSVVGSYIIFSSKQNSLLSSTRSALSISSASASQTGNSSTKIAVTVTNTGSANATIHGLVLQGYARQAGSANITTPISGVATANASAALNTSVLGALGGGVTGRINQAAYASQAVAFQFNYYNMLNFVVNSSGQLSLPNSDFQVGSSAYVLAPGKSATFIFNGTASVGSNSVAILLSGQVYSIRAIGSSYAAANSTASAYVPAITSTSSIVPTTTVSSGYGGYG